MEKYIETCRQQEQREQDLREQKLSDEAAGRARVYLRNISSGKWDRIAKYAIGMQGSTRRVTDIDPTDYIANGKIKVRVIHDMTTTSDGNPFKSYVDLVEVLVE